MRRAPHLLRGVRRQVSGAMREWRTASASSQRRVLGALVGAVVALFVIARVNQELVPLTSYLFVLLIGLLLLRSEAVIVLVAFTAVLVLISYGLEDQWGARRIASLVSLLLSCLVVAVQSWRTRTGLPVALGESVLADLRDLLQSQSRLPLLPHPWRAETAMIAAEKGGYAGDFLVAELSTDRNRLEMILVDVCGKGVTAGTRALQFQGSLGGLIGELPPVGLMESANRFLLRQESDDAFSTAIHVLVDLSTGRYDVVSAGHPPALRWAEGERQWSIESARGMALGVVDDPDFEVSSGVLAPGDALMFYTDGVVESRDSDLDEGVDWLRERGRAAVASGFAGAPRRIISQVSAGRDDRAVLILSRQA